MRGGACYPLPVSVERGHRGSPRGGGPILIPGGLSRFRGVIPSTNRTHGLLLRLARTSDRAPSRLAQRAGAVGFDGCRGDVPVAAPLGGAELPGFDRGADGDRLDAERCGGLVGGHRSCPSHCRASMSTLPAKTPQSRPRRNRTVTGHPSWYRSVRSTDIRARGSRPSDAPRGWRTGRRCSGTTPNAASPRCRR